MATQNRMNSTVGTASQIYIANTNLPATFQSNNVLTTTVQMTSTQIKAMNASPIEIIPAPGSGKYIVILSTLWAKVYGGSNAFVNAGGQTLQLQWGTLSSPVPLNGGFSSAALTSTTTNYNMIIRNNSSTVTNQSKLENKNIVATQSSAIEITGNLANDNVINITVWYNIFNI